MKVAIPGGSGQVGTILARVLHAGRHEVVVDLAGPARSEPVAAGKHGDDLCAPVRCAQTTNSRAALAATRPMPQDMDVQHRRRARLGSRVQGMPDTGTRQVVLRSAMTMSPDPGGIFDTLLGLVRRGVGGKAGDGRQFVSWIHQDDFVRAVVWLIDHAGVVNLAAPHPLPNAEFIPRVASGRRRAAPRDGLHVHLPAMG